MIHAYGRLAFDQLVMNGRLRAPRGYTNDVVNPKQLLVSELEAHRAGQRSDMARDDPSPTGISSRGTGSSHRPAPSSPCAWPCRKRLKDDLLKLAERAGKPLSEYCREVLTDYYLGALWD